MTTSATTTHVINASGKRLGRVASEAAKILIGKDSVEFARNKAGTASVKVENASKLLIADNKRKDKTYKRYSGYPGGLKHETLGHLSARLGYAELVKHAVKGMLPKNRLQSPRMNRLKVTE